MIIDAVFVRTIPMKIRNRQTIGMLYFSLRSVSVVPTLPYEGCVSSEKTSRDSRTMLAMRLILNVRLLFPASVEIPTVFS